MLGQWQSGRAAEKRALRTQLENASSAKAIELPSTPVRTEEFALKRVAARGTFVEAHTVYLDNKLRRGRAGYEVVTPLRLNGMHVLVNRGWIDAGRSRQVLPEVFTPPGEVRVVGLALERLPQALEPAAAAGRVRQNLDLKSFGAETGLTLQPIVIEQHSFIPDGLAREWPRPDAGVEKHESYALQWYSLAALAVVLFLVFSFRRVAPR